MFEERRARGEGWGLKTRPCEAPGVTVLESFDVLPLDFAACRRTFPIFAGFLLSLRFFTGTFLPEKDQLLQVKKNTYNRTK